MPRRSSSSASRRGSGSGGRARPTCKPQGTSSCAATLGYSAILNRLLPAPMRGDFRAYGKVYRHLTPEQQAEAHSIALERQHALNWLAGLGDSWDDVPLDT